MKLINLFFVVFAIVLLFVASCKNSQNEDPEFKKMCQDYGYEWMLMKPTQDGKFIKSAEECWGCMIEGIEHVCEVEKFNDIIAPR